MLHVVIPSAWRNVNSKVEYTLGIKKEKGETTVSAKGSKKGYEGEIRWYRHNSTLVLLHIECHPPRSGLGALLIYTFSCAAVQKQLADLSINNANPGEHGFYKHMGFDYDARSMSADLAKVAALIEAREVSHEAWVDMLSFKGGIKDTAGNAVLVTPLEMSTRLKGNSGLVRAKSLASLTGKWQFAANSKAAVTGKALNVSPQA